VHDKVKVGTRKLAILFQGDCVLGGCLSRLGLNRLRPRAAQLLKRPTCVWALDVYVLPPLFFKFMFGRDSVSVGDHADNRMPPWIWG